MHSGQTRAVLARKARAGVHSDRLLREKRMGDLSWQMNLTQIKLKGFNTDNQAAKAQLEKLYNEAKAEYDRLKIEAEIEAAAEDNGVYLG